MSSTTAVNTGAGHVQELSRGKFDGLDIPERLKPSFQPLQLGRYNLQHRIALAPLTRDRALGTIPHPNAATYYGQRATNGGLLISEGTCISVEAHGYIETPGIYTPEQIEGWRPVVKDVRDKGGVFFCQLWHCGRASHQDYQPNGAAPLSSSPVAISEKWGGVFTPKGGPFPYPVPRALELRELPSIVQQYADAARNAISAGFSGVEIHGANGYLLDQFLKDGVNKRTDEYGGSIERRCRLVLEVTAAVVEAVGADRTGIRLGPFEGFLDNVDSQPYGLNSYLIEELNKFKLAYIHMIEPRVIGNAVNLEKATLSAESLLPFRLINRTAFMAAGGYHRDEAVQAISSGRCDMVAFGRSFLANPDLIKRFLLDYPLNKHDRSMFYVPEPVHGYIDYPTMEELEAKKKKKDQGGQDGHELAPSQAPVPVDPAK